MEKVRDTATKIRLIGEAQMLSPVPRGIPQQGVDFSDPLRQLWVVGVKYER